MFQVSFFLSVAVYNFYDNEVSAFWKSIQLSTIPKAHRFKFLCIFCQVKNVLANMLYFPLSALKKENILICTYMIINFLNNLNTLWLLTKFLCIMYKEWSVCLLSLHIVIWNGPYYASQANHFSPSTTSLLIHHPAMWELSLQHVRVNNKNTSNINNISKLLKLLKWILNLVQGRTRRRKKIKQRTCKKETYISGLLDITVGFSTHKEETQSHN